MNSTVYIFGKFNSGYSQFPDDYTNTVFQKFFSESKSKTQVAIHRNGNLMYYGYVRKLEQDKYIGFCVVLNGQILKNLEQLFSLFENTITDLVTKGQLIHFNSNGVIVTKVDKLYLNKDDIDSLTEVLRSGFDRLDVHSEILPSVNYGLGIDSVKHFSSDDDINYIIKSSYSNGYTFVYKDKDYDSVRLDNYRSVLKNNQKEITDLKNEISKLNKVNSSLKNKQRNMTLVSIFGFVIFIMGIILWNKVLYPSEVTKFKTKEFVYYGPIKDGKPHGQGVAFYYSSDVDGRQCYLGNFDNGKRKDTSAKLFYKDGSYFSGSMTEDALENGVFFNSESNVFFIGTFNRNSEPYTGTWYKQTEVLKLQNGN